LDREVVIVGGGVIGCALAFTLTALGVEVLLVEAEPELGMGASGSNSGILHTGFDSVPGVLETELILRSRQLRESLIAELDLPFWRCGARLSPRDSEQRAAIAALASNARVNNVEVHETPDGGLLVPGESLTDPLAFTLALAGAARGGGAEVRLDAPAVSVSAGTDGAVAVQLDGGERLHAAAVVNCAGLHADELARSAGDDLLEVYPRKGEFLVFEQPAQEPLREILLPVPSKAGKGVLVFPTVDGHVIAGPTARDRVDKRDWSVETDAGELILGRARELFGALEGMEPIAAYAGLRPAGRDANYVIEPSPSVHGLMHVAAIRSTGLTASLGIAEHVAGLLGAHDHSPPRALTREAAIEQAEPWWQVAARRSEASR
jgi:glycerol-3-phosphate dehydrogenase